MPYLTIPQLPSGVAPSGNEPFESVQNGSSVQLSLSQILSYVESQAGAVSSVNGLSGVINILGSNGITASVSGNNIVVSGAQYYPLSNPSGYITGFNSGNYITVSQSGQFASSGQVAANTSSITNLTGVSGNFLQKSNNLSDISPSAGLNNLRGASSYSGVSISGVGNTTISVNQPFTAITLTLGSGTGIYTGSLSLSDSNAIAGDLVEIAVSYPASTNPTLNIYDNNTGGTLLVTSVSSSVGGNTTLSFVFNGSNWVHYPKGALLIKNLGTGVQTALSNALNTASGLVTQDADSSLNGLNFNLQTGPAINFLGVGDSLTAGFGVFGPFTETNTGNFSYTACLASSGLFYNGSVFNAGYAGYTVAQIAALYANGVVQTTVTTTAGSTSATITGSTSGLLSLMLATSPNTVNPSTNSQGTIATISGTAVTLSNKALVSGSCTMNFANPTGYPGIVNLNYPTPLRNAVASGGSGLWYPEIIQPAYLGVPTITALWAGATDTGAGMAAGYATSSGNVITFATPTIANCTWTSSAVNGYYPVTVATGTSIAGVVPGMTVEATTGMTSAIFVIQVDYLNNVIYLNAAPSGSGTNASLTFQTVTSGATGYNAFYSSSNSDAQLSGTVSGVGANTVTMSSAPGLSGTQLIVLNPQQTAYRTTFQTLVTKMVADNPANGVIIIDHQAFAGLAASAPLYQSLCNGNSKLWNSWMKSVYANNAVAGVYLYKLDERAPFGTTWNATYGAYQGQADGVHPNQAAYQWIAYDLAGFIQSTYSLPLSGPFIAPFTKGGITRNYLDNAAAYADTATTWTAALGAPSFAANGSTFNFATGHNPVVNSSGMVASSLASDASLGSNSFVASCNSANASFFGSYVPYALSNTGAASGSRVWQWFSYTAGALGFGPNSGDNGQGSQGLSLYMTRSSGTPVAVSTGGVWGFLTSATSTTTDTGLSRDSAGVIDVGNGTAGNTSGSLKLTNITAAGSQTFSAVSGGLVYKSGSNARVGSGTLVGGTLAVANTSVTANSFIMVQDTGGGVLANIGALYLASQTAGTGFTVSSSNALDTSTFKYIIAETA